MQRRQEAGEAILIYSVDAPEMSVEELSWFVDDTLSRELLAIGGVARVARGGGTEQEITISAEPGAAGRARHQRGRPEPRS